MYEVQEEVQEEAIFNVVDLTISHVIARGIPGYDRNKAEQIAQVANSAVIRALAEEAKKRESQAPKMPSIP
jgi:hypothetical protein